MRASLPTPQSPVGHPPTIAADPLAILLERTAELLERLANVESVIVSTTAAKKAQDWYSTADAARTLGKAEFTVREWCRLKRVNAKKRSCGRGLSQEWMISNVEVERIRSQGLLPMT